MRGYPVRTVVVAATMGLAIGCTGPKSPTRPRIEYGVDVCDFCRMTISVPTWASVAVDAGGHAARFDDLHCLAGFLSAASGDWSVWVHAVDTDDWVDASSAWFGRRADRVTPMGSGWTAYASRSAADSGSDSLPVGWETFRRLGAEVEKQAPAVGSGAAAGEPEDTSSGGEATERRRKDDS
jgi:copper chaperone NosL